MVLKAFFFVLKVFSFLFILYFLIPKLLLYQKATQNDASKCVNFRIQRAIFPFPLSFPQPGCDVASWYIKNMLLCQGLSGQSPLLLLAMAQRHTVACMHSCGSPKKRHEGTAMQLKSEHCCSSVVYSQLAASSTGWRVSSGGIIIRTSNRESLQGKEGSAGWVFSCGSAYKNCCSK